MAGGALKNCVKPPIGEDNSGDGHFELTGTGGSRWFKKCEALEIPNAVSILEQPDLWPDE